MPGGGGGRVVVVGSAPGGPDGPGSTTGLGGNRVRRPPRTTGQDRVKPTRARPVRSGSKRPSSSLLSLQVPPPRVLPSRGVPPPQWRVLRPRCRTPRHWWACQPRLGAGPLTVDGVLSARLDGTGGGWPGRAWSSWLRAWLPPWWSSASPATVVHPVRPGSPRPSPSLSTPRPARASRRPEEASARDDRVPCCRT